MRTRIAYVCQQCGYQSPSYLGRCPSCNSWSSFVETDLTPQSTSGKKHAGKKAIPVVLSEIKATEKERISSGFSELDRVLGGGILKGAVMLLSGDPGIGKSTILLQVALFLAKAGKKILYVSGEESVEQIKLRVDRVIAKQKESAYKDFLLLAETQVDSILGAIEEHEPDFLIIDSIQTMQVDDLSGMAGSVGQVRESSARILRAAKDNQIPTFMIGHVTKEGTIAGPQVLTHMVDTVLFLEGERYQSLRLLRSLKNRFGPVDEVGIFEMKGEGFIEITDPSDIFVTGKNKVAGKAIVLTLEGTRPLLCEIQALVVPTKLSFPKRTVSGLDSKRVDLMIAVLQKTMRMPLERFDIFVSTTSGLKIFEPALDLGICLAIASSFHNKPLKDKTVAISEVSLLGELAQVPQMERRLKEAKRLGFLSIISYPAYTTLPEVIRKVF